MKERNNAILTPAILFLGLFMTGLLATGIAPPIRDIFMDIPDPEGACHGKAGKEILIDGSYFLAEPDPVRKIKPCIVTEITTVKKPARTGPSSKEPGPMTAPERKS